MSRDSHDHIFGLEEVDAQARLIIKDLKGRSLEVFNTLLEEHKAELTKPNRKKVDKLFEAQGEGERKRDTPERAHSRVRTAVRRLKRAIDLHYFRQDPSVAPDKIWMSVREKERTKEDVHQLVLRPIEEFPNWKERVHAFRLLGNNLDALRYVTKQMPRLKRIEETFVRWTHSASNYEAGAEAVWQAFIDELKKHPVLYNAILGPVTDDVLFRDGGLHEALKDREFKVAETDAPARVYRLNHSQPLMNFTILYYTEKGNRFAPTNDVEVLFGFGISNDFTSLAETHVFASHEPRLWQEYQRLFGVLRSPLFSQRLPLDNPDLFTVEPDQCDVIATFTEHPHEQIVRKFKAIHPREVIRVCITGWRQLDDESARRFLKPVLDRREGEQRVKVEVVLWKLGSPFLDLRQQTIEPGGDGVEHEVKRNRDVLARYSRYPNLEVKWSPAPMGPGAIFIIGDLIYFGPYWAGESVALGPHFLVRANSKTGRVLASQAQEIWDGADSNPIFEKS